MTILRIIALIAQLRGVAPDLGDRTATDHASLAVAFATPSLSPELLLAVVYVESDMDPTTVSRPRGAHAWGFCGVFQTIAMSERECIAQRDLAIGYELGVRELTWWMHYCGGDVACALRGHGCGGVGAKSGVCGDPDRNGDRYAERVLRIMRRLR